MTFKFIKTKHGSLCDLFRIVLTGYFLCLAQGHFSGFDRRFDPILLLPVSLLLMVRPCCMVGKFDACLFQPFQYHIYF